MERRPIVAIPADCIIHNHLPKYCASKQYISTLCSVAKVIPIIIPEYPDQETIDNLLNTVDGVLASGAISNVHPSRYSQSAGPDYEPFDLARDNISFSLIDGALKRKIPLLGICRGLQEINVHLGGTLDTEIQRLPGRLEHRSCDDPDLDKRYRLRHEVEVVPNGLLHDILGTTKLMVNSLHRQAICKLAPPLKIEARATDGTIESVSLKDSEQFLLAVQWHPEYWASSEEMSQKIIKAFSKAVYNYAGNKK